MASCIRRAPTHRSRRIPGAAPNRWRELVGAAHRRSRKTEKDAAQNLTLLTEYRQEGLLWALLKYSQGMGVDGRGGDLKELIPLGGGGT